ncbi:hypothetical protein BCR39DRAFT_558862 [Naematelia encephala]|uniref:Kinase n=1 Tax=Naematelia encephala TaxID=71784 RepID=A0A1Y2B5C5_9TREE|nr:hypothetical protein BCR39DRAFT_558862 [Naematelia encephala]
MISPPPHPDNKSPTDSPTKRNGSSGFPPSSPVFFSPDLRTTSSSSVPAQSTTTSASIPAQSNISSSSVPAQSSSRKGKEREKERPTMSSREVGSATIKLRRAAVDGLVNDDDELGPNTPRSRSLHSNSFIHKPTAPSSVRARNSASNGGGGSSAGAPRDVVGFADYSLSQQAKSPSPKRNNNSIRFSDPAAVQAPFRSRTLSSKSLGLRRQRAKSLHFPSETTGIDQNFYLPHFSLDREYSLKPDSSLHTRHGHPVNLELGLGDDFDASFGEALRRGASGEELPLPKEALRALSEAKENLDASVLSKSARKGSIGMGLFRESRGAVIRKMDKERLEEVIEEVVPTSSSPMRVASPTGMRPIPLPPRSQTRTMSEDNLSEATSASIQIVSSPRRRRRSSQTTGSHLHDAIEGSDPEDDSGWTSSSTGSFTDIDKDELSPTDVEDQGQESETTEEEKLTVPLQPFGHAVGGHSSIYQFTRRAVCKPLVSGENKFYEDVELLAPALLPFIPRYLGVMVVNIRRVDSMTPNEPDSRSPAISAPPTPGVRPQLNHSASATHPGHTGVEVPEVSLGFNRHVVPDWLFKSSARDERGRTRGRLTRHSSDEDSTHRTSALRPSSAKSADFMRPDSQSPSSSFGHMSILSASPSLRGPNSPAISVPYPIKEDEPVTPAPSPANSPHHNPHLHHTISTPALPHPLRLDALFKGHEEHASGYSSPHPSFGGTGSTTVNTKLKDHVFATILKRLKKKGIHVPHRHDGDADDEGDESYAPSSVRCSHRRGEHTASGSVVFSRPAKDKDADQGNVRRTKSDVVLHGNGRNSRREESEERGLFAMEEDEEERHLSMRPSKRSPAKDLPSITPMTPVQRNSTKSPQPVSSPAPHTPIPEDGRQELFIFMEDLTGRLKRPCVVDLKMGTRQYGCDATPQKMLSQRKKCDETTSRSLGVRMCGMQVWNNETEEFLSKDKYIGRSMKTADFKRVLRRYLSDGDQLLSAHIPVIIQRLHKLAAIMLQLDGFRFYGCSLLLIYDGDKETQEHYARHVAKHEEAGDEYAEHRHRPTSTGQFSEMKDEVSKGRRSRSVEAHGHHTQPHPRKTRGELTIRLVDFAHTTTGRDFVVLDPTVKWDDDSSVLGKGYNTKYDPETGLAIARFPPKHRDSPDMGFLFGLKSICEALRQIWNDESLGELQVVEDDGVFREAFEHWDEGDLST